MDTWIVLKDIEGQGERNRGLAIVKSRGMSHSNQFREYRLTDKGFSMEDVSLGETGGLTGTVKAEQEAKEAAQSLSRIREVQRMKKLIGRKRTVLDAQLASLRAEFEAEEEEITKQVQEIEEDERGRVERKTQMAFIRQADKNRRK